MYLSIYVEVGQIFGLGVFMNEIVELLRKGIWTPFLSNWSQCLA